MKKTRRTQRVGELVRDEIAAILQREIHDPEIRFVTITDVEVSVDLRIARVHISIMGTPAEQETTLAALERNKGRIRHLLGQRASLRTLPELSFHIDTTAQQAEEIERLLAKHRPAPLEEEDDDVSESSVTEGKSDDHDA